MFISDKEIATATTVVFSFYSIGFVEQSITVTITPNKIVYRIEELKLIESATNEIMNQHFHGIIKVEAVQSDQVLTD